MNGGCEGKGGDARHRGREKENERRGKDTSRKKWKLAVTQHAEGVLCGADWSALWPVGLA